MYMLRLISCFTLGAYDTYNQQANTSQSTDVIEQWYNTETNNAIMRAECNPVNVQLFQH